MAATSSIDLAKFYPDDLVILTIEEKADSIILYMQSKSTEFTCPCCNSVSHVHHGTYHRRVQDLPLFQKTVWLDINAYEYTCENPVCNVQSMAETFHNFLHFKKRMTERCRDFICMLALETSCESSAKICRHLGIRTSGDSIIRMLIDYAEHRPAPIAGACIGVDDFAYKKGQTYCTVIVNEEDRNILDVLEGRDGTALKTWLKHNKQIRTVTRDRASAYAKAIAEEFPDAMQVADRFHLHQNLMLCVKDILAVNLPAHIKIPKKPCQMQQQKPQEVDQAPTVFDSKKK